MEQLRNVIEELGQLLVSILRPAGRSLRQNSGLAVLSVVLAFGLWIFVTDAENPTRPGRLPGITVEPVNIPSDVALADELPAVSVSVRVEENVFDSLTPADFEATVNLEGLAVGEYELEVEVRSLTSRGGLRIVGVLPEKIPVRLAQLVSKEVPVTVDVRGQPPADFIMTTPNADDETVVVAGPQEKVDLVTQAVASLDVAGRTESVDQSVRLEPLDQRGELITGVSLDPALTRVKIDIEQKTFSRALVISPQVVGTPARGYNVVSVSVNPLTVAVSGSRSFIEEATVIRTQPISIDGAEEEIVRTVSLDVPPGAKVIGNVSVTVTIEIVPATGQLLFVVPVSATGLDGNLSIVGSLPTVQVTLFGPLPTLLRLNPNDISASVDLTDKDAGTHKVKIKALAPEGLEVRSISPEEIEIVLENR